MKKIIIQYSSTWDLTWSYNMTKCNVIVNDRTMDHDAHNKLINMKHNLMPTNMYIVNLLITN